MSHTVMFNTADILLYQFSSVFLSTCDCCNQTSLKTLPWTPVSGAYNCSYVWMKVKTLQMNTLFQKYLRV